MNITKDDKNVSERPYHLQSTLSLQSTKRYGQKCSGYYSWKHRGLDSIIYENAVVSPNTSRCYYWLPLTMLRSPFSWPPHWCHPKMTLALVCTPFCFFTSV
jgi:hypothetical protein